MDFRVTNSEGTTKIEDLDVHSRNVNGTFKVVSMTDPKTVTSKRDMSRHRVAEALVGDDTGSIYLTLWDEEINAVDEGQILKLNNGYIKLFRGSMRLRVGRYGDLDVVEEAPFEEVNREKNLSSKVVEYRRRPRRPFGSKRRY
jgi:replication factor A1